MLRRWWIWVSLVLAALVLLACQRRHTRRVDDVPFVYMPARAVAAVIPPDTESLGLLSHYDQSPVLSPNLLKYVTQLCTQFDVFVLLTNERFLANAGDLPPNCRLVFAPNHGMDFGKWMYVLHNARLPVLRRLGLFNNSVLLVRDIRPFFRKARKRGWEAWGITRSEEIAPHIQSYFVVADSSGAARHAHAFFAARTMDHVTSPSYTKADLVAEFEIGLSKHMDRHFDLRAFYSMDDVPPKSRRGLPRNPSVLHWDTLLARGCPLLKTLRRRNVPGNRVLAQMEPEYARTLASVDMDTRTFSGSYPA